jgi:hypothetical protein
LDGRRYLPDSDEEKRFARNVRSRVGGCAVRFILFTASDQKRRILEWAERITCLFATNSLTVSNSLRDQVIGPGLCSPARIAVLGSGSCAGVDPRVFDPDHPAIEGQLARSWALLRERFPVLRLLLC